MRQITRTFHRNYVGDYPVDNQLNEYLKQHSNYSVEKLIIRDPTQNWYVRIYL